MTALNMWFVVGLFLLPSVLAGETASADLSLSNVVRTIDLTSQLVKMSHAITVANGGSSPAKSVHFVVDPALADKVAFVGATQDKAYLRVSETKLKGGAQAWRIDLKSAVAAGSEAKLDVDVVLGKAVEMYPKEITQREKQYALFNGNHYVYAPYKVKSQTTKFVLPSTNVESYTKTLKPVSQADKHVTYGPYENADPFKVV